MALPINYVQHDIQSRHYAMTHNWEFVLQGDSIYLPKELHTVIRDLNAGTKYNGVNIISALCQQVSPPNTNVSTVEGNVKGVHFHQIQTRASAPVQTSLVFYETHNYALFRFFELWKSLEVSRWDGRQNPECRIHSGVCVRLRTHDRDKIVIAYPLYETFCTSAAISDPQGAGSLQQVSVTLQSSNYGIVIPSNDIPGSPAYLNMPEVTGYLGSKDRWITATGEPVTP